MEGTTPTGGRSRATWRDAARQAGSSALAPPWVLAAALHVACGILVATVVPLVPSTAANRAGVISVGAVAAVAGLVIAILPWRRWPERATVALVPESLALVVAFNHYARQPFLYSLFFIVVWVWVGATQPRGIAVATSPFLVVAYLAGSRLGTPGPIAASASYVIPVCIVVGESVAWVATGLRRAEASRSTMARRFEALVAHANDFVAVVDDDGVCRYATPATGRLLGRRASDLVGSAAAHWLHPDDRATVSDTFDEARRAPGVPLTVEYRVQHRSGRWRWVEGTISNLVDDPAVGAMVINGRDISDRKAAAERLADVAYRDGLTGLANRTAFLAELERRLHPVDVLDAPVALLFIDLDGFKQVNDGLGHVVGDAVLRQVAARLQAATAPRDVVARLGGDEFAVVSRSAATPAAVHRVATHLLRTLSSPVDVDGIALHVGASIGIAIAPDHGDDAGALLAHADVAMYRAKRHGSGVAVYGPDDDENLRDRLSLVSDLRAALPHGIAVHYQPKIDLVTGEVVGAEALARWHHPTRGAVGPDTFIPVAEQAGLIVPLTFSVLSQALAQCARWRARRPEFGVAVNLSVLALHEPTLVETVADELRRAGVAPAALTLEITESALTDLTGGVSETLTRLRALGVRLSIDDFGTGYASLAYLKHLPADELKIDRTFVDAIHDDPRDGAIVAAVIDMATRLDLSVVAEGIETADAADHLRRIGCRVAQGYLLCRPADAATITEWLVERWSAQPPNPALTSHN